LFLIRPGVYLFCFLSFESFLIPRAFILIQNVVLKAFWKSTFKRPSKAARNGRISGVELLFDAIPTKVQNLNCWKDRRKVASRKRKRGSGEWGGKVSGYAAVGCLKRKTEILFSFSTLLRFGGGRELLAKNRSFYRRLFLKGQKNSNWLLVSSSTCFDLLSSAKPASVQK